MDMLTFFVLVILGVYFYSQGSIFFAFLTAILVLILVLTSGGSITSSNSGSSHGGSHGHHSGPLYPEKMTIEIGDIDHSSGPGALGERLYNTGYFIAKNIARIFPWREDKDDDKKGH